MIRPPTIAWIGGAGGHCEIIDQRILPQQVAVLQLRTVPEVWDAIRTLAVRGAPAIGIAAAYGMVIAGQAQAADTGTFMAELAQAGTYLKSSRPTAVNLEWAVDRVLRVAREQAAQGITGVRAVLLREATAIHQEDQAMCDAIGRHGAALIPDGGGVLTHCNAGNLATGGSGTALAIMYEAQKRGLKFRVFADETRPLLQGARLTAWELSRAGVDVTIICDNMAAMVMAQKKVNVVIAGADRIAANGDTANKIGTYSVATLAAAHGIPMVIAAPTSTFDLSIPDGSHIPIEERAAEEITRGFGRQTAPDGVKVYNPAFDVTPARLIHAIVTERGIISPVNVENVRRVVGG